MANSLSGDGASIGHESIEVLDRFGGDVVAFSVLVEEPVVGGYVSGPGFREGASYGDGVGSRNDS